MFFFFFSSRRRHTRLQGDWSSDVCSSDLLKTRITSSDGNVESIVYVDERARAIYFSGQGMEKGRDPYYRFLYRIGFDGRGQTLLTPEDADHQITMAPDGASFIDSYSTPVRPPVTVLRDRNGRVVVP